MKGQEKTGVSYAPMLLSHNMGTGPQHRAFVLSEYNPEWVKTFEKTARILRDIFGSELVRIHHIGSTSIPGMLAKPQVDLLMEVKDLDRVKNFYEKMEEAGFKSMGRTYTRRPDNEYFVKDGPNGERLISVHTYQEGNDEIKNIVVFRDYLRQNQEARDSYINKKRELYKLYSDDYPAYRKGKFELIERLKQEAIAWDKRRIDQKELL